MTTRNNKNALMHGVFSETLIILGEDPHEFDQLYESVRKEWNPEGPTEEDAVETITKCLWRKSRVGRDRKINMEKFKAKDAFRKKIRANREEQVLQFIDEVEAMQKSGSTTCAITEENLTEKLDAAWVRHIRQNISRKNYESDGAWLDAIVDKMYVWLEVSVFKSQELKAVDQLFSDELYMEKELALEERLNGMIAKAIKQLSQSKAMKGILFPNGHAPVTLTSKPLKEIESPPTQIENADDASDGCISCETK